MPARKDRKQVYSAPLQRKINDLDKKLKGILIKNATEKKKIETRIKVLKAGKNR
jgi:hypothetical protein